MLARLPEAKRDSMLKSERHPKSLFLKAGYNLQTPSDTSKDSSIGAVMVVDVAVLFPKVISAVVSVRNEGNHLDLEMS